MVDETLFADVISTKFATGEFKTDIWVGLFDGFDRYAGFYPSMTFLKTLELWSRVWGVGILSQRLFSVTMSVLVLIMVSIFSRQYLKVSKFSILWILFLIINDQHFLDTSRVSRPEILVSVFGFISLLAFSKWFISNSRNKIYPIVAGICSGLALLTHPLGLIYVVPLGITLLRFEGLQLFRNKNVWLYISGMMSVFIINLITLIPVWSTFMQLQQLILDRRTIEPFAIIFESKNTPHVTFILIIQLIISLIVLARTSILKADKSKFLLIALFFITLIFGMTLKLPWYLMYFVPFFYMYLVSEHQIRTGATKYILQISLVFLTIATSLIQISLIKTYGLTELLSYDNHVQKILAVIPENKSVYISSWPDPYFGFKQAHRNNRLYGQLMFKATPEKFMTFLDQNIDFVIWNRYFMESLVVGDLFVKYLETNSAKVHLVEGDDLNAVYIIELTDRSHRVHPSMI